MARDNNDTRKVSEEFVIKVFDKVRDVNEELAEDVKNLRNAVIKVGEAFNKRYEGQPSPAELHALLNSWGKTFEIRHKSSSDKLDLCATRSEEIHTMLREHCDHAEAGICSIEQELRDEEGSFLSIQEKVNPIPKIKEIVESLKSRVNLMIGVVAVAFGIFVLAYFFVSASVDKVIEKKMHSVEQHYQDDLKEDISELKDILERHIKWDKQGKGE